jgi:hypothetical protein
VIELFPPLAQFFRESGGARPLIVEKARRGAIKRGAARRGQSLSVKFALRGCARSSLMIYQNRNNRI